MLNGGDTGPEHSLTLIYSGASMVIGALVNAHLFGLMITYIQYFSLRERRVLSKLMLAHNLIRDLQLSSSLRDEVKAYMLASESRIYQ